MMPKSDRFWKNVMMPKSDCFCPKTTMMPKSDPFLSKNDHAQK